MLLRDIWAGLREATRFHLDNWIPTFHAGRKWMRTTSWIADSQGCQVYWYTFRTLFNKSFELALTKESRSQRQTTKTMTSFPSHEAFCSKRKVTFHAVSIPSYDASFKEFLDSLPIFNSVLHSVVPSRHLSGRKPYTWRWVRLKMIDGFDIKGRRK